MLFLNQFISILITEFNTITEIVCFCLIASNLLKEKFVFNVKNLLLSFIVLQIFVFTDANFNMLISRLITPVVVICILYFLYRKKIIHTIYVYIISYSIIAIVGTLIILPFRFLLSDINNSKIMVIGNVMTFFLVIIVCKFINMSFIFDFVVKKDFLFRSILINIFIALFLIIALSKVNSQISVTYYPIILSFVLVTILSNIAILKSKQKLIIQEELIHQYNEYLPVIDELLSQVRSRQHQYQNNLNALNSLALTCDDIDTLKSELTSNITKMSYDNTPAFLLNFNLKLMAGFIYVEHSKALEKSIHMSYDISNYVITTGVPEYIIVELLGILFDNAIENTPENSNIYIHINSINNQLLFSISNPGPVLSNDTYNNFFKRGYTTKTLDKSNHGFGLYNLKKTADEHNGKIILENEMIEDVTYLKFSLIL